MAPYCNAQDRRPRPANGHRNRKKCWRWRPLCRTLGPSGRHRTWPLPMLPGAIQVQSGPAEGTSIMSLGTILVIILIIFLLGGFSGRFGGYGYGYGHGGVGVLGTVLIVVVILVLLGRL